MNNIRSSLFNTVKEVLNEKNYYFESCEEDSHITYKVNYENQIQYVLSYMIDTYDDGIRIIAELPIGVAVDDTKIRNIYEYLCRVNSTLYHGFFEIDSEDGMLRLRDFFKCYDNPYNTYTLTSCIDSLYNTLSQHFLGILNQLTNIEPEEPVHGDDTLNTKAIDPIDTDIFGTSDDNE